MAVLSRICGQKRPNGKIFKFGLQMASFTESRIKNLSAAGRAIFIKASPSGHFVKAASLNGRFIKAGLPLQSLGPRDKGNTYTNSAQ